MKLKTKQSDLEIQSEEFDGSLIQFNLTLTPEQRLLNHQRALDTLDEILKAREKIISEISK